AGAQVGYKLLWVLLWSTAIGLLFHVLALRVGTVTGKDLAEVCHDSYSKVYRIFIWVAMQCAIVASDIQEVVSTRGCGESMEGNKHYRNAAMGIPNLCPPPPSLLWSFVFCPLCLFFLLFLLGAVGLFLGPLHLQIGSAYALRTLFGLKLVWGVLITGVDVLTFALMERLGSRKLGVFFAFLVAIMAVTCFAVFFLAQVDYGEMAIVRGAATQPNSTSLTLNPLTRFFFSLGSSLQAIGILGSVIMPHNLFLHSSLIVNRQREAKAGEVTSVKESNFYFTLESALSLGVSFLINAAVVAVFATALAMLPPFFLR
ncbi:SLC11A1, partial [Symbiodinium sp. KB8]